MRGMDFILRFVPALFFAAALCCGNAAPAAAMTTDEIANLKGPDRQRILEEGARKEGEVLMIGGLNESQAARPILKAFMAKYPYINAKTIRTDTSAALQRILAEHRARTPNVDLVVATIVIDLKAAGLVQPFSSPALEAYPLEERDPERNWAVLSYTYRGLVAYNTNLVPDSDAPKTFEGLLDPKWKGKMLWTDSETSGGPAVVIYLRKLWGEDKTIGYIEKLAKQDIPIHNVSARTVLDFVVSGERAIMITPALHHVAESRSKGAPINATMQDPVLANPSYFLMLKSMPHPHAAMLLADFLLDKEAQTVFKKALYFPAHPEIDAEESLRPLQPKAHGFKTFLLDDETHMGNLGRSTEIFNKYFMK